MSGGNPEVMQQIEELQHALAEAVIFLRSQCLCPDHSFVQITHLFPGEDEPRVISVKVCDEFPETICEWRDQKAELLENITEVFGTRDMSEFL